MPHRSGKRGVIELPRGVARRIGHIYVYALMNPRDDSIFNVGTWTGQRLLNHDSVEGWQHLARRRML